MPSLPLQAKARNDGLFYTVLVLLAIFLVALRVETTGRLDRDGQLKFFQKRAETIAANHAKYWRQGGAMELYWCLPSNPPKCYLLPEHQIPPNPQPTLLMQHDGQRFR